MASASCGSRTTAVYLLVSASILFSLCVIFLAVFPSVYDDQLHKSLALVKGSTLYPMWRKLPVTIYEKLYFFNITNGEDFVNGGVNLNVSQVGPYTYKSTWIKENIRWYPNKTVSYQERRINVFVPELSNGSEEDKIFTLNGPMITASHLFKDKSCFKQLGLSGFFGFEAEHVVTEKTIKQLAFAGYYDPVIAKGKWFIKNLPFKNGMFSWLYDKNNSYDGTFTVNTGEEDIKKLNVIEKWNGKSSVTFWKNQTCNMINGSSGEMGPPIRDGQTKFTFFQSLFCRSLTFTYTGETSHYGVLTKRFSADKMVFANETVNEENACFDTKPYLPSGVQDISGCQFESPVLISFPHFYLADPSYLDQISGLKPDPKLHSSHFDVEPTTGVTIDILLRAQLNLELEPIKCIPQTSDLPNGVFPILWFEVSAMTQKDLADFLSTTLNEPKIIVYSVTGILILISAILFIFGIINLRRAKRGVDQMEEPILTRKDTEKTYSATNNYSAKLDIMRTDSQSSQISNNSLVMSENEINKNEDFLVKIN